MAMTGVGPITTPLVSPQRPPATTAPVQATPSAPEPQDTFQPSTPLVTGSWLKTQLLNAKPGAMFVLDDFQPTGGQAIPGPFAGPEWLATHGGTVVETLMRQQLTGSLPDYYGSQVLPVLDERQTRRIRR